MSAEPHAPAEALSLPVGQRVMIDVVPDVAGVITEAVEHEGYYMVRLDSDDPEWPPVACLPRELRPIGLVYTWESFDSDGEQTETTSGLGPLDIVAELRLCEGLSESGARSVFPVLAAPGSVTVEMPGGWSFRLTSEEER